MQNDERKNGQGREKEKILISRVLNRHRSLGSGVGLRPAHYPYILKHKPKVPFFEALSENYFGIEGGTGARPLRILEQLRKDTPIVLHGVSMSIGSTDPLNMDYLKKLKILIDLIEPEWVSDHFCWTGVDGQNLHDLLPLPYTAEAVQHVTSRITQVQEFLGRQLLFENVSSYFSYSHSEMTEWEFIMEITRKSGCLILLDINNIHVSSVNHGFDSEVFLCGIDPSKVGQFHLAGYSDMGEYLIDTHDHPVSPQVWNLFEKAVRRFGDISTLIEWDAKIPPFEELLRTAKKARRIMEKVLGKKQMPSTTSKVAVLDHH